MKFPVDIWSALVTDPEDRSRFDALTLRNTNTGPTQAASTTRRDDTDVFSVEELTDLLDIMDRAKLPDSELAVLRKALLVRTDVNFSDPLDDVDENYEVPTPPPAGTNALPPPGTTTQTRTAPQPPAGLAPAGGTTSRPTGSVTPATPAQRLEAERVRREGLRNRGLAALGGTGTTWAGRADAIAAWRTKMKEQEKAEGKTRAELWEAIYNADRMSIRQVDQYVVKGEYFQVKRRQATAGKDTDQNIRLARGPLDINTRLEPANFRHGGGEKSRKNELGLHDLSASLLDHNKPIPSQLKGYSDALAIFMPVPSETDGCIFLAVSELARAENRTSEIVEIRSEMTRVKFAQGCDMHTTYIDIGNAPDRPQIRYGVAGTVRRTKGGTTGEVDEADLLRRANNAIEHSAILGQGATETVNEIVLAYRAYGSPYFPLFAEWDGNRFNVVTLSDNPEFGAWRTTVDNIERERASWVAALPTELEREKTRGESDWPSNLRLPEHREKRYQTTPTGEHISQSGVWSDR